MEKATRSHTQLITREISLNQGPMYAGSPLRSAERNHRRTFSEPLLTETAKPRRLFDGDAGSRSLGSQTVGSRRFQPDDLAPGLHFGQEAEEVLQGGTSVSASVYNVLNVYVGLGLLSKPYAIAEGGWLSLAALALLCFTANLTGKLIVRGFAKLPREEQSYAALGEKAFGPAGRWLVSIVVTLEFFGALMVVLIFVWKNTLILWPRYPGAPSAVIAEATVALVTTLAATPTVWALDFAEMSAIGLIGVVASALIVGVTVAMACVYYFSFDAAHASAPPPPISLPLIGDGFPMAIGIFVLSLGGHAALPGVYASMAEQHKFDLMLDISLATMFFIYASVGLCGYLAYGWLRGEEVDVLITTNMARDPGLPVMVMTVAVVAKSFCAISPITGVLAELPELLFVPDLPDDDGIGAPEDRIAAIKRRRRMQRVMRTTLLWLVALCAFPCSIFDGLAVVEAVTGAMCSMLCSLALPCACWSALYWNEVPMHQAVGTMVLAGVAAAVGALFTAVDFMRLGQ